MIKVEFLMTVASSTGVHKVELANFQDITVVDALKKVESQGKKAVLSKIMNPDLSKFKPGVLVLAGYEGEMKTANPQTILKDQYQLKVTTIVGGG